MTALYSMDNSMSVLNHVSFDPLTIGSILINIGIVYKKFDNVHQTTINNISMDYGFVKTDVTTIDGNQWMAEHYHEGTEARLFIRGKGIFYVSVGSFVHVLECEPGDFVLIPSHTYHWFTSTDRINAVRFFTHEDDYTAHYKDPKWAQSQMGSYTNVSVYGLDLKDIV